MSGVNMIKFERLKQYEQKEGSRTTADASAANTDKTAGMAVKRMLAYFQRAKCCSRRLSERAEETEEVKSRLARRPASYLRYLSGSLPYGV